MLVRMLVAWLVAMPLVVGMTGVARADKDNRGVEIGAIPAWVETKTIPSVIAIPASAAAIYTVLWDRQSRFAGEKSVHFTHVAERVLSSEGIDSAANIQVDFDPNYETLHFHHARVIRDGKVRSVLSKKDIRVVQREEDLEALLFRGDMRAILFVSDVRIGDIVEYAYSRTGRNPAFDDHIMGTAVLQYSYPIGYLRDRMLVPLSADLQLKSYATDKEFRSRVVGSMREYVYEASEVPELLLESETPGWFSQYPLIRYSDFSDWKSVAQWAVKQYQSPKLMSPVVQALVDELSAGNASPLERLRAATRFVQDEIRYLGIEVGPHSHQPHLPAEVLSRRFGDCKDKSLLLATVLNGLGVPARPALVHSSRGASLQEWVPSPYAFDHVIVQAEIADTLFWVDPTSSLERGDELRAPDYKLALPITLASTALQAITEPVLETPNAETHEAYTIGALQEDAAQLIVSSVFRGSQADSQRRKLARQTASEIQRGYLNYYAEFYEDIHEQSPIKIHDDQDANEVTIIESYELPKFWKDGKRLLEAREVSSLLSQPNQKQRETPYGLAHPLFVRQRISVTFPYNYGLNKANKEIENEFFEFSAVDTSTPRKLDIAYSYRSRAGYVAPEKLGEYTKAVSAVQDNSGYEIYYGEKITNEPKSVSWLGLGIVFAIIGGTLGLIRRADLKKEQAQAATSSQS